MMLKIYHVYIILSNMVEVIVIYIYIFDIYVKFQGGTFW